jgi:hypothetical protein
MNEETAKQITSLVDKAMNTVSGRELVASSEIVDLLLDIRLLLLSETDKETA